MFVEVYYLYYVYVQYNICMYVFNVYTVHVNQVQY